ncbi:MAG: flagellar biosynthesis protein FlhB [Inhella sp.]|uniref:EscU/YscU/HrcU family type III secretion system export apparatus switch protein n=1 Tax=Inhella sp. TaxID=1921806 RepID=UPI00391BEABB
MADKDAQDHNLPASQRKIKKAREEGQLPRSRDLPHAFVMGALTLLAWGLMPKAVAYWEGLFRQGLRFDAQTLATPGAMSALLSQQAAHLGVTVLLVGGVLTAAAVLANWAGGGWNFTWKALGPKWTHLNPLQGIQRLFSGENLGHAAKASLLALALVAVGSLALWDATPHYVALMSVPLDGALAAAGRLVLTGVVALLLTLAVFAAIDWPLQRQLYLRRLRMSRTEVKQEHKETEGSPEIKARQRQRMREMTKRRMMAAVPKADFVVMNPTHYAVALRYDEAKMGAPMVVAKGADLLALRIRDVAQENRVPVLQAPALARALYAHAKLDREVPMSLFAAVAQVLAYVYQLRAALGGRGLPEAPNPEVPAGLDPHERDAQAPSDEEAFA